MNLTQLQLKQLIILHTQKYNLKEFCSLMQIEYKDDTKFRRKLKETISLNFIIREEGKGRGYGFYINDIKCIDFDTNFMIGKGRNPNSHNNKQPNYPQVEVLLSNYLRKKSHRETTFYVTKEYLALDIGLITKNFYDFSKHVLVYKSYLKEKGKLQNALTLNIFKDNIENVYKKSVLDTALNHIKNNGGIDYSYDYIMQIDVAEENKYNYMDCMLKDTEEQTSVIRVATDLEKQIIKAVNDELIIKYKINQLNDLNYNKKKHMKFYTEQEQLVKKRILEATGENTLRFWRGYEINICNSQVLKRISNNEENKIIQELHELIVEKQKERLDKQIEEMEVKLLPLQTKVDISVQKCIDLMEIWGKPSNSMMEEFNRKAREPFKKEIDKYELYCSATFKKQYIAILESLFLDYDLDLDGILKKQLEKIKKYNKQQEEKKRKQKEKEIKIA